MRRPLLLLVFFLSGASALVFEIVWTRMAGLVFGSTLPAVSTVLAAFMGGMALGGLAFGRTADRARVPLRLYAGMELAIGVLAVAASLALPRLAGLAVHLEEAGGVSAGLVRFVAVFMLVLLPTLLMGGTLPVLTRHLTRMGTPVGGSVASLYAANTLGAVAGCLATDFVLIHHLGMTATVLIAAGVNVLLAAVTLAASRGPAPPPAALPAAAAPLVPPVALRAAVLVAGTCSLAYEVVWTRLILFFNGSDVYVFSLMLGTYLFGMGLGSAILERRIDRLRAPVRLLALAQAGVAAFALLPLFTVRFLGPLYGTFQAGLSGVHGWENLYRLAVSALVVLPPTLLIGMTFPLASRVAAGEGEDTGAEVGGLYFWSTAGSIVGSLLGGFVLLPWLGVQGSLAGLAFLNLAVAALLLVLGGGSRVAAVAGLVVVAGVLAALPRDLILRHTYGARFGTLLHTGEDLYGSLAVVETEDQVKDERFRVLVVNGYSMTATNFHARRYMKLLAHLPLLLTKAPTSALVICFGTGQTVGAATLHPGLQTLDVAELSPVIPALSGWFKDVNREPLKDPRLRLFITDGRTHVQASRERYDVITAEPPPPHNAGVVNLYTKEFFEGCRQALKPGGVVCQWLPVYEMSPADVKAVIRACQEVFPETYLWAMYHQDLCVIGVKEGGADVSWDDLRSRLAAPALRQDLAGVGIATPEDLLEGFLVGPEGLRTYTADTPALRDDKPDMQYGLLTGEIDIGGLYFRREPPAAAGFSSVPAQAAARIDRVRTLFHGLTYQVAPQGLLESLQQLRDMQELLSDPATRVYHAQVLGLTRPVLRAFLAEGGQPRRVAEIALLVGEPDVAARALQGQTDPYLQALRGLARGASGAADVEAALATLPDPAARARGRALVDELSRR